jgi:hypothetical protein
LFAGTLRCGETRRHRVSQRVWQLLLCGAQTVTLTDGIFGTVEPPAPALIVATLGAVAEPLNGSNSTCS